VEAGKHARCSRRKDKENIRRQIIFAAGGWGGGGVRGVGGGLGGPGGGGPGGGGGGGRGGGEAGRSKRKRPSQRLHVAWFLDGSENFGWTRKEQNRGTRLVEKAQQAHKWFTGGGTDRENCRSKYEQTKRTRGRTKEQRRTKRNLSIRFRSQVAGERGG